METTHLWAQRQFSIVSQLLGRDTSTFVPCCTTYQALSQSRVIHVGMYMAAADGDMDLGDCRSAFRKIANAYDEHLSDVKKSDAFIATRLSKLESYRKELEEYTAATKKRPRDAQTGCVPATLHSVTFSYTSFD